jgi:hypothetical protein
MTLLAQHSKLSPTSQNPPLVTPNPGSTDGSHNVAASNKDTNGTMAGPHGDIEDAAGIIPPLDKQPGVQWSLGNHMQHNCWSNVNPSSFTSDDRHPLQRGWPHVDSSSSDSGDMRATNLLSLPHTPESCHCQALKANVSCFNVAALCDPRYHGGPNGLSILTIPDICTRGYMSITSDNVMLFYNTIISMHSKVLALWTNTRTQHSGPSVERIVKKGCSDYSSKA